MASETLTLHQLKIDKGELSNVHNFEVDISSIIPLSKLFDEELPEGLLLKISASQNFFGSQFTFIILKLTKR